MLRKIILAIILLPLLVSAQTQPKREFRGAWLHTVHQPQYLRQTTEQNKQYLIRQLDALQAAGINAVLFQVRPSADAFYQSNLEPWSRFLTSGGAAPKPFWDPLQFMIEQAHARGMELHAWLNPYRVTTSKDEVLPKSHLYHKEPGRFVRYAGDGKTYFDPGLPENRTFITKVVRDIVDRYDIDGIHFDDYFYPYPAAGKDFPDAASFAKYGKDKAAWRRENVDKLIEQVHDAIRSSKRPWVRFGISPFGIWRNKKSDPRGSETSGLQNYDDLYADVLLWAEKGWIDYLIPQLYWENDHPRASYRKLVKWWGEAVDPSCQVYIGQSVDKTMEKGELASKMQSVRGSSSLLGNCWWPAYDITSDARGCAAPISKHQSAIAIVPAYTTLSDEQPRPVRRLRIVGNTLCWDTDKPAAKTNDQVKFVVYRFDPDDDMDYDNSANIIAVTPDHSIKISRPGIYTVTALDRVNNESNPATPVKQK